MATINLLNQTAKGKSTDENSANLINMYLVEDQDQGKYAQVALPTPGATLFSAGSSVIRAMFVEHGITYGIDGNTFFSVASDGTRTTLGTLNTSTGWAKIRGIAAELLIVDSSNGYYYTIATNTFTNITDSNFPTAVQDIECQDEFGLVLIQNSQTWQASGISDLSSWPPLSFASTTGDQNYNTAIVSSHRELYILGSQTSEVWDNLGTVNFTFGRNTSVFVQYGCAARNTVVQSTDGVFFLGQNRAGGSVVIRMVGYNPTCISTRAINYQISTYSTISDAFAFMYQQEGHEFYVLTFPTAGVTWVYDLSTEMWHQRASLVSGNQTQWIASCSAFNYNKVLIGDSNSGNIYTLDMTNYTENGTAITRTLVTHPIYSGGAWVYLDKLQVDFDNTPGAALSNWSLSVSRDGGRTFGTPKAAYPVQDANGMWRVYWLRLGQAHAYVFQITTSANIKPIILGAWANARAGESM